MSAIEQKLIKIEKEILDLKKMMIKGAFPKKKVSLKGILKGLRIEEEDFLLAENSLFKTRF